MSDCILCPIEKECKYPYKPCDCVGQRKFWDAERRKEWDNENPKTCMTDGSPVEPDHREIIPETGMQKGYIVLCPEERAKGFVRPLRRSYKHTKCGVVTTMGLALCETYARKPDFYSGTFCCGCGAHFPVTEFTWTEDGEVVGS